MAVLSRVADINEKKIEKKALYYVWIVHYRRLKNVLFFIGQDGSGSVQLVITDREMIDKFIANTKKGDLIKVWGIHKKKMAKTTDTKTDETDSHREWNAVEAVEIQLNKFVLINRSKELPFDLRDSTVVGDDLRYRYRYLDLRQKDSHNLLLKKSLFFHQTEKFFYRKRFVILETPILSQYSPEGAACFRVPSKIVGRQYTLPQSPQIFKQMVVMGGFLRYFQFSRCFRNEDARGNRQIEFTQLDVEMGFVTFNDIRRLVESFLRYIIPVLLPNTPITISFSVLKYNEVIEKYGHDKPDFSGEEKNSNEFNFCWITDYPLFSWDRKNKRYLCERAPFTSPKKTQIARVISGEIDPCSVVSEGFDLVLRGEEILSGAIRIYQRELQEKVFEIVGYNKNDREKYFGYFLEALQFASPPMGGFAIGVDRLISKILVTKGIKPLITFPKNIDGSCSLTKTPDPW